MDGVASRISFELFKITRLGELKDCSNELGSSSAKKFSKSVEVVIMTPASARSFFAEEVYDGSNPVFESGQGRDFYFDWLGAGAKIEIDEDAVNGGGTGIMTKDYLFFV